MPLKNISLKYLEDERLDVCVLNLYNICNYEIAIQMQFPDNLKHTYFSNCLQEEDMTLLYRLVKVL